MGATDDCDLVESLGEAGGEGPTLSQSSSEKGEGQTLSLETQSQEREMALKSGRDWRAARERGQTVQKVVLQKGSDPCSEKGCGWLRQNAPRVSHSLGRESWIIPLL